MTRPDQTRPDQSFCFNFDLLTLPKTFEYSCDKYALTIWGTFWRDVPEDLEIESFTPEGVQKLNLDGSYLAHYVDNASQRQLVFCGHMENFPFYYCVEGHNVIFSDKFYALAERFKALTLDRDSISDYFEEGWNNILKWDRTPFKEIRRLECWKYMTTGENGELQITSWDMLDRTVKFNDRNLDDFKREFFECADYYLKKIHDMGKRVTFSVSGGLDSSTLAARYVQLFPDNDAVFYTSKIDDVTDESEMALKVEPALHKKIILVDMKTDTFNFLELLKKYIDTDIPPRYRGCINARILCDELVKNGLGCPTVNGMGAEANLGWFGGEYLQLMADLAASFKLVKAYRTFLGALRSYSTYTYDKYGTAGRVIKFFIALSRKFGGRILRAIFGRREPVNDLLKISLPMPASNKVRNHKDAVNYAAQSGEVRDINLTFRSRGIEAFFPYVGYKFYELNAHCDPFIYSDRVNKACQRYAVKDLLPPEIVGNVKKTPLPSMTLEKSLEAGNNLADIVNYVRSRKSRIVDTKRLAERFSAHSYGQKEFLALSLLVFEEKISQRMGIEIRI